MGAERTAEFLRAERERYEYLLLCAKAAEHEEFAWETIVAKMTVEDFVAAAREVLAAREALRLAARTPNFNTPTAAYVAALAAYDRAAGHTPDPDRSKTSNTDSTDGP